MPRYVLTSLRSFPSLKPKTFQPVASSLLSVPLRRDILWKAVVYDADNRRVGASNPKGRSEMGYSRKKLLPQKGTGRARSGDRGSPVRHDGGVAMARTAPNDFTSDLPKKVYDLAMKIALSDKYRQGSLFIIDGSLEIPTQDSLATQMFLKKHGLKGHKLLFITDEHTPNLLQSTEAYQSTIDVVQKEGIEVRDILHAEQVFIDLDALKWFADVYSS
ncbi:54S ribosomal protein YmL6, mitochondrial Flags: Precursor [Cyberlindnera jadinii]|uniref:Large ribosomal subunit protein uL4m n=1 Tax=Cyberlindnera jadinii (strain ATCC 18201 / CBS 1600 / BCRC 20928 / JCM 3617 / NBRC 0987 / NRRL Y-1542) TaxID=983966 RepID=A0A0H5BZC3_CYBJN|nr:54S ribosomal protein YmL6, mitochondrial Flags: Precursor [Cyberlindnera jadinii]